jgi:transcriptional regulator with XRE-family HTH domain
MKSATNVIFFYCIHPMIPNGSTSYDKLKKMFRAWLKNQLNDRSLGVRELCRAADVSSGTISRVLNGSRGPGPGLCQKLAKALDIPETVVFEQAGLLTPAHGAEFTRQELYELLKDLPIEEQRAILAQVRDRLECNRADTDGTEPE